MPNRAFHRSDFDFRDLAVDQIATVRWAVSLSDYVAESRLNAPVIYVMGRNVDHDSQMYTQAVNWTRTTFPSAIVVPSRDRWCSGEDWHRGWHRFSKSVNLGIAITGLGDFVGLGMWRQIQDLTRCGTPVLWLRDDGSGPLPVVAPVLWKLPGEDLFEWAKVAPSSSSPLFDTP